MDIRVHPRAKKYLDESREKDRLKQGLAGLGEEIFRPKENSHAIIGVGSENRDCLPQTFC
jgi:hypothetical protein